MPLRHLVAKMPTQHNGGGPCDGSLWVTVVGQSSRECLRAHEHSLLYGRHACQRQCSRGTCTHAVRLACTWGSMPRTTCTTGPSSQVVCQMLPTVAHRPSKHTNADHRRTWSWWCVVLVAWTTMALQAITHTHMPHTYTVLSQKTLVHQLLFHFSTDHHLSLMKGLFLFSFYHSSASALIFDPVGLALSIPYS